MANDIQLSDATLLLNNEALGVAPNSVSFTEGRGEQQIRAVSTGGGRVEQVFANDLESAFSTLKFSVRTTVDNIATLLDAKNNGNANVFQLTGENADGTFTRTFSQASIVGDYEVPIGTEADIEIEVKSNAAV